MSSYFTPNKVASSGYKIPKRAYIPPNESSAKSSKEWPEQLRSYVQRVFEMKTPENATIIEAKLKATIAKAQSNNIIWTVDWDNVLKPNTNTPIDDLPELLMKRNEVETNDKVKWLQSQIHHHGHDLVLPTYSSSRKQFSSPNPRSQIDDKASRLEKQSHQQTFEYKKPSYEMDGPNTDEPIKFRLNLGTKNVSNHNPLVSRESGVYYDSTPKKRKITEDYKIDVTPSFYCEMSPAKSKKQLKKEAKVQKALTEGLHAHKNSSKINPSQFSEFLSNEGSKLEQRKNRFEAEQVEMKNKLQKTQFISSMPPPFPADDSDWNNQPIVGTCGELYKPYLRLTSAPDPSTVRPLPILKRTLTRLKGDWKLNRNYTFMCDQLKSLRQDLTVQRIRNEFTVQVYELHSRIAIEMGDLGEFNQCSSQLRQLYSIFGIPGSEDEFTAYRILYMIHTKNKNEMVHLMGSISNPGPNVRHALALRSSLSKGDFGTFFDLARDVPDMGSYLVDHFIERERIFTFLKIVKAFRPTIPVNFLGEKLGFFHPGANQKSSYNELVFWITSLDIPIENDEIDCKSASKILSQAKNNISSKGVDIKGQIH